jgi:protein-L-isoaspartate(D-aspartate) O-methyltransferase
MQPDLFSPKDDDALAISKVQLIMYLRKSGIQNIALLRAIEQVKREDFLPKMFANQAYDDVALPIAGGQSINSPSIIAKMIDLLELNQSHATLEVGTGTGYQAAIIAGLTKRLFTIEINRDLYEEAKPRLKPYTNIVSLFGNGSHGWLDTSPYDRIIVNGAMRAIPSELLQQLNDGGIIIVPIGLPATPQKLLKITRHNLEYQTTLITYSDFDPIIN